MTSAAFNAEWNKLTSDPLAPAPVRFIEGNGKLLGDVVLAADGDVAVLDKNHPAVRHAVGNDLALLMLASTLIAKRKTTTVKDFRAFVKRYSETAAAVMSGAITFTFADPKMQAEWEKRGGRP
jgi:hypothetical protein